MTPEQEKTADLHAHSHFSDGRLSPEELVEEAIWAGLAAVALTDHDNVDGLTPFFETCKLRGLEGIAGVELSCEHEGRETHILGLLIEPDEGFREKIAQVRKLRESRMQEMLDRLETLGIRISMDMLPQIPGRTFGRPHLARALVQSGSVRSVSEAFARYIGDTGPANVPKFRLPVKEGIDLVHSAKGVAILAHPGVNNLIADIPKIAIMGADGIEALYPKHSPGEIARITDLCQRYELVLSGGSDFHASGEGPALGVMTMPYRILEQIKERKAKLFL